MKNQKEKKVICKTCGNEFLAMAFNGKIRAKYCWNCKLKSKKLGLYKK